VVEYSCGHIDLTGEKMIKWLSQTPMDPISLIVTALAAGASAALKDTASAAIKDTYAALKTLVRKYLNGDISVESQLDVVDGQPERASSLKQHLDSTGADRDEELLRLSHELLERIDPTGAQAGKYNVNVSGGKGAVIGDNASVTMNFKD